MAGVGAPRGVGGELMGEAEVDARVVDHVQQVAVVPHQRNDEEDGRDSQRGRGPDDEEGAPCARVRRGQGRDRFRPGQAGEPRRGANTPTIGRSSRLPTSVRRT
jgi:hypothetical protein